MAILAQQSGFPKITCPCLGQKPPGTIPEIFAPGIVSKEGNQSRLFVSPDGRKLFFVSNRPRSGKGETEKLPGIWVSEKVQGEWGQPQRGYLLGFGENHRRAEAERSK